MNLAQTETLRNHLQAGEYGKAIQMLLDAIGEKPVVQQSKIYKVKTSKSVSRGFAVLTARLPIDKTGEFAPLEEMPTDEPVAS